MIFNKVVVSRTGRRIPLQPPANFAAKAGNGQVTLTWTDPENETSGGTTYATWDYTRVVRKLGSSPADENDGELVVESSQRNQYQTTGFVDDGLVNDTQYFYGAFARSTDGVWSAGAFVNATPMAGTPLGELAEGTLIKILENGSPVEFYLAKHSYEPGLNGEGRELVVRKDIYDLRIWSLAAGISANKYLSSAILSWLTNEYVALFSENTRSLIEPTSYYYTPGGSDHTVSTTTSLAFLLSMTELDIDTNEGLNSEGSALPIASVLKRAQYNGQYEVQWTRSPRTNDWGVWCAGSGGLSWSASASSSYGSRPCFTLPSTALVDQDLNLIETSPAAQEVAA